MARLLPRAIGLALAFVVARHGSGQEPRVLQNHQRPVHSVAFSPDGKLLASTGNHRATIWSVETGKVICNMPEASTAQVRFTPKNDLLISGKTFWDVKTGKAAFKFEEGIRPVALAPDGKVFACCNRRREVLIYDLMTRKPIAVLKGFKDDLQSLDFSPDGKLLAAGTRGHQQWPEKNGDAALLKIWNVATWKEKLSTPAMVDVLNALAFSSDSKCVTVAGNLGVPAVRWGNEVPNIRFLDVKSGDDQFFLRGFMRPLAISYSPDGKILAACDKDCIILYDIQGRTAHSCIIDRKQDHYSLAFNPDGQTLVVGDGEGRIKFWRIPKKGEGIEAWKKYLDDE